MINLVKYASLFAVTLPLASACSSGSDIAPAAQIKEAIVDGRPVTPFGPNSEPAYTQGIVYAGCSAALVAPSWVLSAYHCALPVGQVVTSFRPTGDVQRTVDAVLNYPPSDAVLLHLNAPFTDIPSIPIYAGSGASVIDQTVSCYGYGYTDSYRPNGQVCDDSTNPCPVGTYCIVGGWCVTQRSNPPTLTTADFVTSPGAYLPSPSFLTLVQNAQGQNIMPGDSGGPCILNGSIAATNSYLQFDHTFSTETNIAYLWDRLVTPSRVQYTVGDFNNDGHSDIIVTTPSSSTWFQWTANGLTQILTDSRLTLGNVTFTTGDFNGDARTDLIVTDPSGSYWWYASTTSPTTFRVGAAVANLPYGTQFTTGNFDGDAAGTTDLVATTASGSTWYYNGSFSPQFTRSDLTTGQVTFTPGDFNKDGKTDLIVTTMGGTQWLYANENKTWDARPANETRTDLLMDGATFTPGDFDGDGRTDVVITTSSGSYWYFATTVEDSWNEAYVRGDLPIGSVKYTAGDYDGDGKTDLVITAASGSYWYYSTGLGTWDDVSMPARSDLPLGAVMYTVNEDNNEAGKDLILTTALGSFWYDSVGRSVSVARITGDAL